VAFVLPFLALILSLTLLSVAVTAAETTAPEEAPPRVEAELDHEDDQRIQERLLATYDALASLQQVQVQVIAGVVVLRGGVPTVEAGELATKLANQVKGVAAVENQLSVDRTISGRLHSQMERLRQLLTELLFGLPLFLLAFVLFLAVAWVGKRLARSRRLFAAVSDNIFLQDLMRQIVSVGALLLGLLLALDLLDATTWLGGALGAAGVVGLALGFAFRDLVENYMASLLLSLRQPFLPQDYIRIAAHEGKVVRLTWRATVLLTLDGHQVRIPNSIVFKSIIENLSQHPERRFSFDVGVGVEQDLSAVRRLGEDTLAGVKGVLAQPAPLVLVHELGDWAVLLRCTGWIDTRLVDIFKVRSEAIRLVKESFNAAGVTMPEPQQRIRLHRDQAAAVFTSPAARPMAGVPVATAATADITRDRHMDQQVEKERTQSRNKDLLQADGKLE